MDNKQKYLNEALRRLNTADHLAYSTFPLVNDKKLLLKILEEIHKSIMNSINSINKNFKKEIKSENIIKIKKNLKKLQLKPEQIKSILEIIEMHEKHKTSAMEFTRKERAVIMLNNLKTITLDINKIKEYISIAKIIYIKAGMDINN